ncbi:hypothetical protein MMC22_001757 [Lobaria immixta]|nr:hypothetical protein [Lobaria immixta]
MPALAEPLSSGAELGVKFSDEVDCFEGKNPVRDAEAVEADSAPTNDPVDTGDAETVALYDEVELDGILCGKRIESTETFHCSRDGIQSSRVTRKVCWSRTAIHKKAVFELAITRLREAHN